MTTYVALPTARERAQAALTGDHMLQPEFVVSAVAAAIELAMLDETKACARVAGEVMAQNTPPLGAHSTPLMAARWEAATMIEARIMERAKRWPDPGAAQ